MTNLKTTLPPGEYYIGDPCYVIEDWTTFLDPYWALDGRGGIFDFGGHSVCAFSTQYGDGLYTTSDGSELPVDAGLIGAIPLALVTKGGEEDGMYVTFGEPFDCRAEPDGRLWFGNYWVMTGDEVCPECGREHDQ